MTTQIERRPSSAIFVGISVSDLDQSSFSTPPPKDVELPSGLPSPPQTISASGSNGDNNSSNSGSIRGIKKPTEPPRETMSNGLSHLNQSTSSRFSDADDGQDDEGEHTARLSEDRQLEGGGGPLKERVQSLADRNRQVLDKLASITSSLRGTPTAGGTPLRTQTPASNDQLTRTSTISKRLSLSRQSNEHPSFNPDDRSTTPPATARKVMHVSPRQRLVSEPTSPHKLRLNSATSGSISSISTMGSRRGLHQIFEPPSEGEGSFRHSPTLSRRTRQPLPREFLTEAFYRDEKSNTSAYASSEASSAAPTSTSASSLAPRSVSRGSLSPGLPTNSLNRSPRSSPSADQSFARRSATLREVRTSSHRAWQSADLNSPETETESSQRRTVSRYEARGGSAESPLAVRSVVGESLKAAGLTRRREPESPATEAFQPRRRIPSGNFNTPSPLSHERRESMRNDWDYEEEHRPGPRRSDAGTPFRSLDMVSQTHSTERLSRQTPIISSSRPSTTLGAYEDERVLSRQSRPSTGLDRNISLGTTPTPKTFMSPSGITRTLPSKNATSSHHSSASLGSTVTEHAHLMQDALHMFESHIQKLPRSNALPNLHEDVIRDARVIIAAAGSLNKALRAAVGVAMDEQVEAEVADEADDRQSNAAVADVWRRVGAEFREDVRVSDELVRTMTSFMIGVGRMLRTVTSSNPSVDGRRSNEGRKSVELSGRRSTEIRSSMDYREEGLRRLTPSRPLADATSNGSGSAGFPERERDIVKRLSYGINEARPSSVLSMIRDHEKQGALDSPTFTHLSSNRQKPNDLPNLSLPVVSASSKQLNFPQTTDGGDRTPLEAPRQIVRHSTLPPLAVPPPLPTLPSESLIRSKSTKLAPKRSRLSSNATVRGTVILPSPASSSAAPIVTPTTASSEERADESTSSSKARPFSFSRAKGSTALRGLQQVASNTLSLNRKRSTSFASEADDALSPVSTTSSRPTPLRRASSSLTTTPGRVVRSPASTTLSTGSSNGKLSDGAKKVRAARVRMSLDSSVTPLDDEEIMDSPSQNASSRQARRFTETYSR